MHLVHSSLAISARAQSILPANVRTNKSLCHFACAGEGVLPYSSCSAIQQNRSHGHEPAACWSRSAMTARDVSGGSIATNRRSLEQMQRIASAEAGSSLATPNELNDDIPFNLKIAPCSTSRAPICLTVRIGNQLHRPQQETYYFVLRPSADEPVPSC